MKRSVIHFLVVSQIKERNLLNLPIIMLKITAYDSFRSQHIYCSCSTSFIFCMVSSKINRPVKFSVSITLVRID